MFRASKVLLIGLVLLLLGGCTDLSWTTAGKIVPPVPNSCPLEGQWEVSLELESSGNYEEEKKNWQGKIIQFTREMVMLGDYAWSNPAYKIKKVYSAHYLMIKYLDLSNTIMPDSKEVAVITVSSGENFLGEFMMIDETKLIAFVENKVLYLKKVSDQADSSLAASNLKEVKTNDQSTPGSSGVLLGLKIPKATVNDKGDKADFMYQTLWLASDHGMLHPVLTGNDVFFPRNSGFWKLQVNQVQEEGKTIDRLTAHDVSTKVQEPQLGTMSISRGNLKNKTDKRIIHYVGNDYVAVENFEGGRRLQILPVDKISALEGIKFIDLLGKTGFTAYCNTRAQIRRSLNNTLNIRSIDDYGFEENFGLTRKNGHWYLRGRINYYKDADDPSYLDFNINLVPPAQLIAYDTLCLSWQYIKDRVPDAVDGFTSPNQDLAIVVTKTKLQVYVINAGQLGSEPLAKIDLQPGASVIMAEWATGSYVDNWEKAFLANGAKNLRDNL